MRVPTTDYTPLMQANAQKLQAKRSQFVAPNIDYQTKSLQLKEKGLDKSMSYLRSQETLSTLAFINNSMGKLVVSGLSAMEAKQAQSAQALSNQFATDYQTFIAQGFANGDFYYESVTADQDPTDPESGRQEIRLHGADKIKAFQDKQIEQINSQPWLKSIKDQATSSMGGFYYDMQGKMAQDFYNKETQDKFKLEQMNLGFAKDRDTAEWHYTDYRNTDAFINSLKGYTPEAKEALRTAAHAEIDLGRAANEVRTVAGNRGQAAGVERANAISDRQGYNPDTRSRLISYANGAASQAKGMAQLSGAQFMTEAVKAVQSGQGDFASAWDKVKENTANMPEEQKKAYVDGAEQVQLDYLAGVYVENSRTFPEDMDDLELEKKIEQLAGLESQYKGTPATQKMYHALVAPYRNEQTRREKAQAAEEKRQAAEEKRQAAEEKAQAKLDWIFGQEEAVEEWNSRIAGGEEVTEDMIRADKRLGSNKELGIKAQKYNAVIGVLNAYKNEQIKGAREDARTDQKVALALMGRIKDDFLAGNISGNAALSDIHNVMIALNEKTKDKPLTQNDLLAYEKEADNLVKEISDSSIENKVYKQEISNALKDIDKGLNDIFGDGKNTTPEQNEKILELHDRAKGALLDLAWDNKNLSAVDFEKRKNEIMALYQMGMYDELSSGIKSGISDPEAYKAAMQKTKMFEDSHATYFDERTGQLVWMDDSFKESYDQAALREREMLEKKYGIDIDRSSPVEYRSITRKSTQGGAEPKELVPVFKDKNGNRYTVQGGKVYHYINGEGVPLPEDEKQPELEPPTPKKTAKMGTRPGIM